MSHIRKKMVIMLFVLQVPCLYSLVNFHWTPVALINIVLLHLTVGENRDRNGPRFFFFFFFGSDK